MNAQNIYQKEERIIIYLISFLYLITLSNYIYTGFATNDDYQYFCRYFNDENVWKESYEYAKMNGRFYFIFMQPLFNILLPYSFGSYLFAKSLNLVVIAIGVYVMGGNIARLLKNNTYRNLFHLFFCIFITIKGSNNPIISYPLYFSTSWLFFQISIQYFLKFKEKNVVSAKYLSLLFYLFSLLFYEIYVVLSIIFLGISYLYLPKYSKNWIERLKFIFKTNLPILCVILIYITVYYVFKKNFSSQAYEGVNVSNNFSISSFFTAILMLSKGGLPLHLYFSGHGVYENCSYILGGHIQSLINPIINIKKEWLFKSVIVGTAFILIANNHKISTIKFNKTSIILISLGLSLIFLPHVLLALTPKYQMYTSMGMDYYITTYFSALFIYIFLSVLISPIFLIKSSPMRKAAIAIFTVIFMWSSVLIDYSNYHAKTDLMKIYNFIVALNELTESSNFNKISEKDIIIAPSLYKVNSDISYYNCCDFDMSPYFKTRMHNNIRVVKDSTLAVNYPISNIYRLDYNAYSNGYYFMLSTYDKSYLFIKSTRPNELFVYKHNNNLTSQKIFLENKKEINFYQLDKHSDDNFGVVGNNY